MLAVAALMKCGYSLEQAMKHVRFVRKDFNLDERLSN